MSAFLGVSKNRDRLTLREGDTSYWCVYSGYSAQPGDILFLYFAGSGVSQVYRILATEEVKPERQCVMRGMQTVSIVLLFSLSVPISARQLKGDSVLREMNATRRNFQQTVFKITDKERDALLEMIRQNNPHIEVTPALADNS